MGFVSGIVGLFFIIALSEGNFITDSLGSVSSGLGLDSAVKGFTTVLGGLEKSVNAEWVPNFCHQNGYTEWRGNGPPPKEAEGVTSKAWEAWGTITGVGVGAWAPDVAIAGKCEPSGWFKPGSPGGNPGYTTTTSGNPGYTTTQVIPGRPGYTTTTSGSPGYTTTQVTPGRPGYTTTTQGNPGYTTSQINPGNPGYTTTYPGNPGYTTTQINPGNPGYTITNPGNPGYTTTQVTQGRPGYTTTQYPQGQCPCQCK